ncbi:hypothetical protein G5V57_21230 [Nordella sp. HKS 07]|uniref:hypothetical protein n=1 Tax=Nordella sp. HKS 07 TaxID=2712222 RepID=UPI0013E154C6|nr:hypothetical protein [Nordella sp. HKS 07]QIG50020.1 hypothetical protein G5V57_21230 [Nordella sp. HKS 07]
MPAKPYSPSGSRPMIFAAALLAAGLFAGPAAAAVSCDIGTSLVCSDPALLALNEDLAAREALLARAPMHQAFRSELEAANAEWEADLDDCTSASNAVACYKKRLTQRIAMLGLLNRLFAGPHLPGDAVKACTARGQASGACYETLFAGADTVYAITARAFETSLAAVNIQTPTSPDGGSQALTAEDAFRAWRTAECTALGQSPMVDRGDAGGVIACQVELTWKQLATLARLLGRKPHWSERVADYAPSFRACLDKGREEDVDLRIIDVLASDSGDVIRLMGSRGRYDCKAVGETVSAFAPAGGAQRGPAKRRQSSFLSRDNDVLKLYWRARAASRQTAMRRKPSLPQKPGFRVG